VICPMAGSGTRVDVCKQRRKAEVNTALSNSFGFGGSNATLVFRKFRD